MNLEEHIKDECNLNWTLTSMFQIFIINEKNYAFHFSGKLYIFSNILNHKETYIIFGLIICFANVEKASER